MKTSTSGPGPPAKTTTQHGVTVHPIAGRFTPRSLRNLDRKLGALPRPRRILVQWTPHSFAFRSLNPFLPLWLFKRAHLNRDRVEFMIHEPFLAFGEGTWRQNLAAVIHRVNVSVLLAAAAKVWVSIPAWETALRPWCFGLRKGFEWLPIPSNIPIPSTPRCNPATSIVGHFGTFRPDIAGLLTPALLLILECSNVRILLAGRGSDEFHARFTTQNPEFQSRFIVTGAQSAEALAESLSTCDLLLQPYPDGISTRRGTAMAALALGIPMVTNLGHLSEPFWRDARSAAIAHSVQAPDLASATLSLLADPARRLTMSTRARQLYMNRFHVSHTIAALLAMKPVRASQAAA